MGNLIMLKKLVLTIDSISVKAGKVFSYLLIVVVFSIAYEIVARYFFNSPTQWASEAMVMGCALFYVIGGAWALYNDRHIKMELLYGKLSNKNKAAVDIITSAFFFLYLGMFLYASIKFSWESILYHETSGSAWNPPIYPIKIAITIGTILLILQGIANFIRNLYFFIKGKKI